MSLLISDELIQASGFSEAEILQEPVLLLFQREKLTPLFVLKVLQPPRHKLFHSFPETFVSQPAEELELGKEADESPFVFAKAL